MYDFSVDYDSIDKSDILNNHKYLWLKILYKMLSLIEKTFIGLFTGLVNGSNHTNVYG